jgi:hypothetical protein
MLVLRVRGTVTVRVTGASFKQGPRRASPFGVAFLDCAAPRRRNSIDDVQRGTTAMILSTVRVEDFERFWDTFSTKGAEKRKQHGSKGSQVFRDPNDDNRIWVLFDWDEEGYKNLLSDPEMPALFQEAGLEGRPQTAELARHLDA